MAQDSITVQNLTALHTVNAQTKLAVGSYDVGTSLAALTAASVTGPTTPASAAATGVAGTILWDSGFIYVCVATNTWKRVAIATW